MAAMKAVGVVGAGYISDLHVAALRRTNGVEPVAICDVSASHAAARALQHGLTAYTDLEQMVVAEQLSAVHLTTPANTHAELVRQLFELGVDVLVEKPFVTSSAEAVELSGLAGRLGRRLGVSHNMSFDRNFVALRDDVHAGRFGRIDHVDVLCIRPFGPLRSGPYTGWLFADRGNPLIELGPHSASMLLDLTGVPDVLTTVVGDPIELTPTLTFPRRWDAIGMAGAVGVRLCWGFGDGYPEFRVHVRGSSGAATADLQLGSYATQQLGRQIHEIDGFTSTLSTGFGQVATSARTMAAFTLGKLGVANGTGAFEQGIADAVAAFHSSDPLDPRLSPRSGIESVQLLERIIAGAAADLPAESATTSHAPASISTTVGSTSAAADSAATPSAPILVIGGAGLIGQQVVKHLIDTGHRVRVMSRRPDRGSASGTHPSLEIIAADFTDPTAVAAALSGVEVVCHLAFGGGSVWSDVLKNDVEPTLALVDAAAEAGVRRFVFSSTIAVYWAGRRAGSIDEQVMPDDGVLRVNPYARGKALVESRLAPIAERTGMQIVIVRPGIVVGPGASPVHWGVGAWPNPSVCALWGSGDDPMPFVSADECGRAIAECLTTQRPLAPSYNLVGDVQMTGNQYLDAVERGGQVRIRRVRNGPVRYFSENVVKWGLKRLGGDRATPRPSWHDADGRTVRATWDNSLAKRDLAWVPVADRARFEAEQIEQMARSWYR